MRATKGSYRRVESLLKERDSANARVNELIATNADLTDRLDKFRSSCEDMEKVVAAARLCVKCLGCDVAEEVCGLAGAIADLDAKERA